MGVGEVPKWYKKKRNYKGCHVMNKDPNKLISGTTVTYAC